MTVLLAIRIGGESKPAARAATDLAERIGGRLHLVYVAPELEAVRELATAAGRSDEQIREQLVEQIRERCREELEETYPEGADLHLREGDVAAEVVRAAQELNAAFLVVGMRGRSTLAKLVLGDTTGAILANAPCPVVVIPPAIHRPSG